MTHPIPSNTDTLLQRGLDLLAAGFPSEASLVFRSAIKSDPTQHDAYHGLVCALRDAGQLEEAISAARNLIELTPDDPLAHTALSIVLQQAGRIPEAEAAAARARILEWKVQLRQPVDEAP